MKLFTFDEVKGDVEKFKIYLKNNYPEIPKNINEIWLAKFLKVYDFDIEKSASLLKVNLVARTTLTIFFDKRDFYDSEIIKARNTR